MELESYAAGATCWQYFFGTGRTIYSCEVLNILDQELTFFPPLDHQLLLSRFVNTHCIP